MKKKTKVIIAVAVACAGTFVLGACGGQDRYTPYREQGFNYTVIFDSNGGMLASNSNTQIKYLLKDSDVAKGCKLHEPNDADSFGNDATTCSWDGHFLAGWYRGRTERKNADGDPLDDYGYVCKETPVMQEDEDGNQVPVLDDKGNQKTELLSENGRGPAYTYSDRWDFSKKVTPADFNVDSDGDGTKDTLLLYAGWAPHYQYRIHWSTPYDAGDTLSIIFDPLIDSGKMSISLPTWGTEEERLVKMNYGSFPQVPGKTFSAAYYDAAKTQKIEGSLQHPGEKPDDPEFLASATCEKGIMDIYADYIEGDWCHVYEPKDLATNMSISGCYEIYNDLDFSQTKWTFNGAFKGELHGNNHTISNITVTNGDTNSSYGGLFGRIQDGALFENVTFENLIFNLEKGTRQGTGLFGLFAGEVDSGVKFENVKITGKFVIGCQPDAVPPFCSQEQFGYQVGVLSGNGTMEGKVEYNVEVEGVGNVRPERNSDETITIKVVKE